MSKRIYKVYQYNAKGERTEMIATNNYQMAFTVLYQNGLDKIKYGWGDIVTLSVERDYINESLPPRLLAKVSSESDLL